MSARRWSARDKAKYQIAVISAEYPPNVSGGVGIYVGQIVRALSRRVRQDLFVPKHAGYSRMPKGSRLHQIPVLQRGGGATFWLGFCHGTVKSVEGSNRGLQLIHCHDWMTVLAGIRLRESLKVPLVFSVHLPAKTGYGACFENLGLVAADVIVVNSREIREELIARNLPIHRIEVAPNGVDTSEFCLSRHWPRDDGYILFVGRFAMQKGIDVLLQAFAIVLRRCPESKLVIVGDGDLELYLKRLVSFLGIPHRVSFVKWQDRPALVKYYQKAAVVVVPSYYEPFGLVALEAMACGRPVIASRTGGLCDIIENDAQGLLVSVGNYLDLAAQLTKLILDSGLRRKIGKVARARALMFSWERASQVILTLYASVADRIVPDVSHELIGEMVQGFITDGTDEEQYLCKELLCLERGPGEH